MAGKHRDVKLTVNATMLQSRTLAGQSRTAVKRKVRTRGEASRDLFVPGQAKSPVSKLGLATTTQQEKKDQCTS